MELYIGTIIGTLSMMLYTFMFPNDIIRVRMSGIIFVIIMLVNIIVKLIK